MSDWDARRYHRLSDPQLAWGQAVLSRLAPGAGERILDLGCGTGRLTSLIAATPGIVVVGLDRSASMLSEARRGQTPAATAATTRGLTPGAGKRGQGSPLYVRGDGAALPFVTTFDAVFSAATFHWIPDHDRLFASVHDALKAGGRLDAQSGGGPNLHRLYDRARALMAHPRYAGFYEDWSEPWRYYGVAETKGRLAEAGFTAIDVTLVPAPVTLADRAAFAEFVECVCLRPQLDRLPPHHRAPFVDDLTQRAAHDEPAFTLDYWRLNISARKGRA